MRRRKNVFLSVALSVGVASSPCQGQIATRTGGEGTWHVRARAVGVMPRADLRSPIGGTARISDDYVPEIDASYFFTEHLALEALLGTTRHRVRLVDSRLGDVDFGSVRIIPPGLILQYHPGALGSLRPYAGAGVTYTLFVGQEDLPGPIERIEYRNAPGYGLQAGMDIDLAEGPWALNVDVKRVALDTEAVLDGGFVTIDVSLHTWILSFGAGYRFGWRSEPAGGTNTGSSTSP